MAPKRPRGSASRTPPPPRGTGDTGTGGAAAARRLDALSSSEENSLLRGSDEDSTVLPGTGPRRGPPPPAPVNAPRASTRTTPVGPKAVAHGPPAPTPAPETATTTGTGLPYATPVQALLAHAGTGPTTASTAALPVSVLTGDGPRGSLVVTVPHNLAFPVEITVRTDPRERR